MDKKLIPIIGLVVVVGVAGFFFFTKNNSTDPNILEKKVIEQEVMSNCKYDKEFCKYMANMATAYKDGVVMTTSYVDEKNVPQISKTMQDGNGNMETVVMEKGVEQSHIIFFNKYSYIKSPSDNVWIEYPPAKDEPAKQGLDLNAMKDEMIKMTKEEGEDAFVVKKLGTEKCGKYNCVIFSTSSKDAGTTKMWIDDSEFLSRKMEMSEGKNKTTIEFDYTAVKIAKPSPVKQMPKVEDMMDKSGNLDMDQVNEMMKDLPGGNVEE